MRTGSKSTMEWKKEKMEFLWENYENRFNYVERQCGYICLGLLYQNVLGILIELLSL